MITFESSFHAQRRENFLDQLGAAAAVIPAAALVTHHADCEWPFRQDSDFFYLTGFDEPDAVALLLPHRPVGERYILFVQPKDAAAEVWTGFRWGTEGAMERYGADLAHPLDELPQRLPDYLSGAEAIAFRVGRHPAVEPLVLSVWGRQLDSYARSGDAAASEELNWRRIPGPIHEMVRWSRSALPHLPTPGASLKRTLIFNI